jgi:hypothetical protein
VVDELGPDGEPLVKALVPMLREIHRARLKGGERQAVRLVSSSRGLRRRPFPPCDEPEEERDSGAGRPACLATHAQGRTRTPRNGSTRCATNS